MTDNELLLAISNKKKKKLKPMENEIHSMQDQINSMQGQINSMQDEIHSIKGQINSMQDQTNSMQDQINSTQNEMHEIKLFQENVILPRLNTIESCYLDTYKRYKKHADKMDIYFMEHEVLKKVVAEHSEILQKNCS